MRLRLMQMDIDLKGPKKSCEIFMLNNHKMSSIKLFGFKELFDVIFEKTLIKSHDTLMPYTLI